MAWSLDWFAAVALARAGKYIRRVAWTDRWLAYYRGVWWMVTASESRVVKTTDFGAEEFHARDWTEEAFNANPCAATPAYNQAGQVYGQWTNEPIFTPPPVPGFPDPDE